MKDLRVEKLAKMLLIHSVELKENESILIELMSYESIELGKELLKQAYALKAKPYLKIWDCQAQRITLENATQENMKELLDIDLYMMEKMDAYIKIYSENNSFEFAHISSDNMDLYKSCYVKPLHYDYRVNNTKWCLLMYPNHSIAQLAKMCLEDYEEFFFNSCIVDYAKMGKSMDILMDLLRRTDKVRVTAKDTDITFSIKGIGCKKCYGKRNIPDGEVYSAPVKDSINGVITYNTPTIYNGVAFENIKFVFKDGKIIDATCNNTKKLNEILDVDEGARYIGEFALAVNPYITRPMLNSLFDEKIAGSIHLTPGASYKEVPNGNDSSIHWDLVLIQTPEYGGGEIWFDDKLIRLDGRFILQELECLNPENLK